MSENINVLLATDEANHVFIVRIMRHRAMNFVSLSRDSNQKQTERFCRFSKKPITGAINRLTDYARPVILS